MERYLDLKELDERPYMYQEIFAYDGSSIKEGIDWLVDIMKISLSCASSRLVDRVLEFVI